MKHEKHMTKVLLQTIADVKLPLSKALSICVKTTNLVIKCTNIIVKKNDDDYDDDEVILFTEAYTLYGVQCVSYF